MQVAFYNMIGLPGETIADFRETVKLNRICLPDSHFTSIFFPYPGTDIYLLCKEQGLLNGEELGSGGMERSKALLDLPGFPKRQIEKGFIWFDYYVYKGYKPIYRLLYRALTQRLRMHPYSNYIYRRISNSGFFKWLENFQRSLQARK